MINENDISIVIPLGPEKNRKYFRDVLSNLNSFKIKPLEIILVIDGTMEKDEENFLEIDGKNFRIITFENSKGPATARNAGASAASGSIILFCDADVLLPRDTIPILIDFFNRSDSGAVVSYYKIISEVKLNTAAKYKNSYMRNSYRNFKGNRELSVFLTSAAACKKEDFEKAGRFDENYISPSIEDSDFGKRLKGIGTKIFLLSNWEIVHLHDYRVLDLIAVSFSRAAAIMRMSYRRRAEGVFQSRTASRGYLLSMFIPILFILSSFMVFYFTSIFWIILTLFWVIVFYILNLDFLVSVFKENNARTYFFTIIFLPIDVSMHLLGAIWGIISFHFGVRY